MFVGVLVGLYVSRCLCLNVFHSRYVCLSVSLFGVYVCVHLCLAICEWT